MPVASQAPLPDIDLESRRRLHVAASQLINKPLASHHQQGIPSGDPSAMSNHFARTVVRLALLAAIARPQTGVAQQSSRTTSPDAPVRSAAEEQRIGRLELLADVWTKLELFHPAVATRGSAWWDSVFVRAVPRIEAATSDEETVAVLNELVFGSVGDPLSFARTARQAEQIDAPDIASDSLARTLAPRIGYLDARNPETLSAPGYVSQARGALGHLGPLDVLLVDARWQGRREASAGKWLGMWTAATLPTGQRTSLLHRGTYWPTRWIVQPGDSVTRVDSLPPIDVPTVFLANLTSYPILAQKLDALQRHRGIAVVLERSGPLTEVTSLLTYPGLIRARIQSPTILSAFGALDARPDTIFDRHLSAVRLPAAARAGLAAADHRPTRAAFDFPFRVGDDYPESDEVPRDERILGLVRLWSEIRWFHANRAYARADADWERVLHDWIPRVEAAVTLRDYYFVLRRLTARLDDSHIIVAHLRPTPLDPPWSIPVDLRRVQGRVVVVRVDTSLPHLPLQVGDEILTVNGRSIRAVEDSLRPLISASRIENFYRDAWEFPRALIGPKDSPITLGIRRPPRTFAVTLPRSVDRLWSRQRPPLDPVRRLSGNVGYIELDALTDERGLDSALTALRSTSALILDGRRLRMRFHGSLRRALIDRFLTEPVRLPRPAAFDVYMHDGPPTRVLAETWDTWVPDRGDGRVLESKPLAVIVDNAVQSYAEAILMELKWSRRATFVGSATAGTNGGTEFRSLPGGGWFSFSIERAMNPDGSRFHGVGLVPDVLAEPTVEGIRAHRDEVLERAIATIRRDRP